MKGADVAMASIVQYNDWLEEEVRVNWDWLNELFYECGIFSDSKQNPPAFFPRLNRNNHAD